MNAKLAYYYEMYRNVHLWKARTKIWNYVKYKCLGHSPEIHNFTPQIAGLLITKRCNLRCGYCINDSLINGKKEDDATLDKIKVMFENPLLKSCIAVDLQGGDPLLVEELDSIVAYLVRQGRIVSVSTNGLLLLDKIEKLKHAGISRINISLYDANRKFLDNNLKEINEIFPVHTTLVLLRSDVEQHQDKLIETVKFVHDVGCRSLRFLMYRPMGINPKIEEEITENMPSYLRFRKQVDDMLPGFCLWPVPKQTSDIKKSCPQLWQRITYDVAGNVLVCCGTDMILDKNLFCSDVNEIINHPEIVDMRRQLLDKSDIVPEICKKCSLLGNKGW